MLLPEHSRPRDVLDAESDVGFDPCELPVLAAGRVERYAFSSGLASCPEEKATDPAGWLS